MPTDLTPSKIAIVGILGLQVVLAKEGSSWVAQGIELDYAAAGASMDDVKKRFHDGLCESIREHLNRFGHLDNFITHTPAEVWLGLMKAAPAAQYYSSVSTHRFVPPDEIDFPFGSIRYLVPEEAGELPPEAGVH